MTYQIGDKVNYWRAVKKGEPDGTGEIYSLGDVGGAAVAWINGCRGCIALTHIEKAA